MVNQDISTWKYEICMNLTNIVRHQDNMNIILAMQYCTVKVFVGTVILISRKCRLLQTSEFTKRKEYGKKTGEPQSSAAAVNGEYDEYEYMFLIPINTLSRKRFTSL